MAEVLTEILSILTVISQVFIVAVIISFVIAKSTKKENIVTDFVKSNSLLIAFLVALSSMIGSLFYSEIIGYDPCKLCWLQRIFIYPQVVTIGLALWKKDNSIFYSSIVLSVIGVIIAGYHYLGQISIVSLNCDVVGLSSNCSQRFFMYFGYITIPMMSLTAFLMIITMMIVYKNYPKN